MTPIIARVISQKGKCEAGHKVDIAHWQQIRIDRGSLNIVETYPETAILNLLNNVSHNKL